MIIASDGGFWHILPDGAKELLGRWELYRRTLEVVTVKKNSAAFEDRQTFSLGTFIYKVIFADNHELVLEMIEAVPGTTKLRFTR